jgi:N-acyl-D-aspartate/D-glutamate deacylase
MPSEMLAQRLILAGGLVVDGSGAAPVRADAQAELGLDDEETLKRLSPAGAIYFLMNEADVERIMCHPLGMVGSDGLLDRVAFEQPVQASEGIAGVWDGLRATGALPGEVLSRNTRRGSHE